MSNTLATSSIVAKTALPILKNMLSFTMKANRDYEDEYDGNMSRGYAPGATINIKRPPRYTYRAGSTAVPQATTQSTIPLTLSQGGCDIQFKGFERTYSLTKLEDKIAAAIAPVANEIDRQGLQLARFSTFNTLNPAGALPATQAAATSAILDANRRLDEMGAPRRDGRRAFIMGPALNGAVVGGFAGMFNSQSQLTKQYGSGLMENAFGIDSCMDQNVDVHTNGAATATAINGAGQVGSAITVVGVAGGTLTRGTVITLPGVFAVNPQSRVSTNVLAQFVVTADVAAAATSIPISPAIVTSGAFKNVTASPTTAAAYVIMGAASTGYACNVAFHSDAFTLACVPMWMPTDIGVKVSQQTSDGLTIKVTEGYDVINDNSIMRIDVLYGWAAAYPELAVKWYSV